MPNSFELLFDEVVEYECGFDSILVVSGEKYSQSEAAELFSKYWDVVVHLDDVDADRVRFRGDVDEDGDFCNGWWLGSKPGKGSRRVWTIEERCLRKRARESSDTTREEARPA